MFSFSDSWILVCNIFITSDTIGFHCYLPGNIFFKKINFIAFGFVILSDLNFNPNSFVIILFIRVFLVDYLMCLNISLIVLKISMFSLSGSILMNMQLRSCPIAFCLFILQSIYLLLCPFFISFSSIVSFPYSHENTSQYRIDLNLKHYIVLHIFFFKWIHYFCYYWLFLC